MRFTHLSGVTAAGRREDGRLVAAYGILARLESFLVLAGRISVLVVLFVVVEKVVRGAGQLPQESYFQRFLFVELGEHLVRLTSSNLLLLLPAALITGFFLVRFPAFRRHLAGLWHGWAHLEHGLPLRLFMTFVAFIAAWTFSTYDFNLYFGQGHYADRVLLILLVPLLFWRPVFVFPFLLLLVAIIAQFDYPLRAYPWTEINLPIRILVLFFAAFLLHGLTGRRKTDDFLFVLCCLIAVNYWWSGLGKFELNWISHPHLNLLLFGAYANGWLAFLEPSTIVWLSKNLMGFNVPLMVYTLLMEWGALFILWRRCTLLGFLVGFIVLHLGIFAVTGMFFWKWILVELGLLWFLLSRKRVWRLPIFTRAHFLLSLILIGGCVLWVRLTNLSWYDTPVTYTYRMEGVGESGKTYSLPTRTFTPYGDVFTLGIFMYLSPHPQLTRIWGITNNHPLADTLLRLTTPDQIYALEQAGRKTQYDEAASARFDTFMVRFISNLNLRRSKRTWFSPVHAPPHLWSFPRDASFRMQEPITKVIVYQVTSFYDGAQYAEVRKRAVREVDIPSPAASPAGRRAARDR